MIRAPPGYVGAMSDVIETIEVSVPIRTAYNQWTQFEEFPRFMEGVQEIRQLSDRMTHWKIKIGGVEREFDAEITEQHPDCLLYTSDAADEEDSVDLGGRR